MTSSPTAPQQKLEPGLKLDSTGKPPSELATPQSITHKAPQPRHFGRWPVWLGAIVALLLIAVVYWEAAYVSGIEFNSFSWEQRAFSVRRDPFTGTQLTAVQHNPPLRRSFWRSVANPHAHTLPPDISQYLNKTPTQPVRWDLVRLEQSKLPGGEASILVELLKAHNRDYAPFWPQWSIDHPRQAALLWPAAQHLVEFRQYEHLPALLKLALVENSLAKLKESIGQLVQRALLKYCQQPDPQASSDSVQQAAQVGLLYGPHPQLQQFATLAP